MNRRADSAEKKPIARLEPSAGGHGRFWAGFLIFILAFYLVAATAPAPGLTWDEAIYLGWAEAYIHRIQTGSFSRDNIREFWQYRVEPSRIPGAGSAAGKVERSAMVFPREDHPPVGLLAIAGFLAALGGLVDPIISARLSAAVCFALVCMLLYFFVRRRFGTAAALFAAFSLFLMPHVFAHAHFATMEMPVLLTWLLTVIAFEKGTRNAVWSVLAGVFFGLALLTRLNAVVLPFILVPWGAIFYRKRVLPNLVAMLVLAPLVFLAGWPAMWVDTLEVVRGYMFKMSHRFPIPCCYFGRIYFSPAVE